MTTLELHESSVPDLTGQTAIVTGGVTGIGQATVNLLVRKGAKVHILDIQPGTITSDHVIFHHCNVTDWASLSNTFLSIPQVDMVFINAGVSERSPFLDDLEPSSREEGPPFLEPTFPVLDVNLKASINCIKLAIHQMKHQEQKGGRIVITASSTAYMSERSMPMYSAMKLALVGLVRSLRPSLPKHNITINAVAPAATSTPMISDGFMHIIKDAGLPWSPPEFVAVALVFSATGREAGPVDTYGGARGVKVDEEGDGNRGRWNGRVIVTMGDKYTEIEEGLVKSRSTWFGESNAELTIRQQAMTMKIDGMG